MKKRYVGNLSPDTRKAVPRELFARHGKVRSIRLAADVSSRKCRGFGFIEMEGHEARAATAALNGTMFKGRPIKVNDERSGEKRGHGRSSR